MAQPMPAYQSVLPGLITSLIGTKSTTGGGTSNSTSSMTSSADTDPLRQVFGQQMKTSTPEGMQAVLGELFNTGAQQVPVLTQAYANATGTRSTKNSGLALALAELNKGLTGQAATLLGKQQADTAQTAANIAQATRGTTTTGSNTTPKMVNQTGNPKAAGLMGAAGLAMNAADKFGLTKSLKGMMSGKSGLSAGMSAPVLDANSLTSGFDSYDLQGGANANLFGAPQMDFTNAGVNFGSPDSYDFQGMDANLFGGTGSGIDWANEGGFADSIGDWSNGFADSGGVIDEAAMGMDYDAYDFQNMDMSGVADAGGGFMSDVGDFFSSFFSDGGLVKKVSDTSLFGRRREALEAAEGAAVKGEDANKAFQETLKSKLKEAADKQEKPKSFADGGIVRNKNNMGGRTPQMGTAARNGALPQIMGDGRDRSSSVSQSSNSGNSLTYNQIVSDPILKEKFLAEMSRRNDVAVANHNASVDEMGKGRLWGETEGSAVTGGDPGPGGAAGALGSLGVSVAAAIGSAFGGPLGGIAASQAAQSVLGQPSLQSVAINGIKAAVSNAFGGGLAPGEDASSLGAVNGSDMMSDTFSANNIGNTSAVGGFGGFGGGPGEGPGMGPGASAGTGFGGGSTGAADAEAADGGHIKGKGTGISDSINARLSDGEFVFSADVVEMLGADFLQSIHDKLHTPVAQQKAMGAR